LKLKKELYEKKIRGDEVKYKNKIRSKKLFHGEFYDPAKHIEIDFNSDDDNKEIK
jgi:hypothetical protein